MKPFVKAVFFLVIVTVFEFLFRKGFIGFVVPFNLPQHVTMFTLFTLFALAAILVTRWFCKRDKITPRDLGISLSGKNRLEFLWGFLIGVGLWALVSYLQAVCAGFSWEFRPNVSLFSVMYGLIFIFIADLGTELYTRGYPLTKFEDSFGSKVAIIIMVFFVSFKSFSFEVEGELLMYSILIPALHTIFFSIIYFKTRRLGAPLGLHVGANFITISIFDLRVEQASQAIPAGIFQPNIDLELDSIHAIQMPWVLTVVVFSVVVYFWWKKGERETQLNE